MKYMFFEHRWNAAFIGFVPMMIREALFMANVDYLGPMVGKWMKSKSNTPADIKIVSKDEDNVWDFVGRGTFGLLSTTISHPFDTAARFMQTNFRKNPTHRMTIT